MFSLLRTLDEFLTKGPASTISIHRKIFRDEAFIAGKVDTKYLERTYGTENDAYSARVSLELTTVATWLERRITCLAQKADRLIQAGSRVPVQVFAPGWFEIASEPCNVCHGIAKHRRSHVLGFFSVESGQVL